MAALHDALAALDPAIATPVGRYLRLADRLLPARVVGFYLIGSVALGAHRPGRSDIDFVAVVDGELGAGGLRRLRAVHVASAVATAAPALARGQLHPPGTCNGVYVRAADLERPVSAIPPLASHTGAAFQAGRGFDVNPVQWRTLATRGVRVRGADVSELALDPEPGRLRQWNLDNLASYWVPWAERVRRRPGAMFRGHPRWWTAWGVLGAPRLHHTIATGDVISKEEAGGYARTTFDDRWHPLIDDALAFRDGRPAPRRLGTVAERARATAGFVLEVAADARRR